MEAQEKGELDCEEQGEINASRDSINNREEQLRQTGEVNQKDLRDLLECNVVNPSSTEQKLS